MNLTGSLNPAVRAFEVSTEGVPGCDRVEYWRATAGTRLAGTAVPGAEGRVTARACGMIGPGVEFVDYQSRAMWINRTARMCRSDTREELSLGLVLSGQTGAVQHDRELRLQRGDLSASTSDARCEAPC